MVKNKQMIEVITLDRRWYFLCANHLTHRNDEQIIFLSNSALTSYEDDQSHQSIT